MLRLADSYRLCFLILDLCLDVSIVAQNSAALLMTISDGVRLILLHYWSQEIVDFIRLVRRKPKLIFPAETVLLEKPFSRFNIYVSPSVRIPS